jgi:hypothetical protein
MFPSLIYDEPNKVKPEKIELPDCFIYMDDIPCTVETNFAIPIRNGKQ